jgi:hypothetical protein
MPLPGFRWDSGAYAAAPGLLPLIWPDDRSPMGSDASRSIGPVGATNRTVVPITVMVRI